MEQPESLVCWGESSYQEWHRTGHNFNNEKKVKVFLLRCGSIRALQKARRRVQHIWDTPEQSIWAAPNFCDRNSDGGGGKRRAGGRDKEAEASLRILKHGSGTEHGWDEHWHLLLPL
jgi:hypothetical protein